MMTFTTVGFGDYHVTKSFRKRISENVRNCSNSVSNSCIRATQPSMNWHQGYYIVLSMIYILCGLILTGSAINFLIVHCMVPKREEVTVRYFKVRKLNLNILSTHNSHTLFAVTKMLLFGYGKDFEKWIPYIFSTLSFLTSKNYFRCEAFNHPNSHSYPNTFFTLFLG